MEKTVDRPFVVVCGCPRSGTYLLAEHMGKELGIAVPMETHLIPQFQKYLKLWGPLNRQSNLQRLHNAIEAYSWIWIYIGNRGRSPEDDARTSLLSEMQTVELDGLDTYQELLRTLFTAFRCRHDMPFVGDKSTPFEPEDLTLYDLCLPNMRVVHIIRDGRDVCLSWCPHWFGPKSVAEAAWIWRKHISERRRWGQLNPDRYHEVQYEDFVADPAKELRGISSFLGLGWQARDIPWQGIHGETLKAEVTHQHIASPIDNTNVGKWQDQMTEHDRALFESIAGQVLERCGYAPSVGAPGGSRKLSHRLSLMFGLARRYLALNYYLRRGRAHLPLLIRVIQWMGLDASQLARRLARSYVDRRFSRRS